MPSTNACMYSCSRVSSPVCTLHTAITHVSEVAEPHVNSNGNQHVRLCSSSTIIMWVIAVYNVRVGLQTLRWTNCSRIMSQLMPIANCGLNCIAEWCILTQHSPNPHPNPHTCADAYQNASCRLMLTYIPVLKVASTDPSASLRKRKSCMHAGLCLQ